MRYFKFYALVLISFIAGCQSPSNKIVDKFKEVNESIEKSNESIDSLTQDMKFAGFDKAEGDSIRQIFNKASLYIRILKKELDSADSNGEKLDISEKLIVKTPKGDSLYKYIKDMYKLGIKYGDSSLKKSYASLKETTSDKWLNKWFRDMPTVGARTILSKFQNDLVHIKTSIMSADILELKNKILSEK